MAVAEERNRKEHVPAGEAKPFRIVMGLLAFCIVAAPLGFWVVLKVWNDVTISRPVERLLAEGSRLAADGFLDEAAGCFKEALAIEQHNDEVQARLLLCDFRRGLTSRQSLESELSVILEGPDIPAGFEDLLRAELAIFDNDLVKARQRFERALARCDERLRFDVLHGVDHLREWAATDRFCLTARFPSVEENCKALTRVTFRPAVPARLTIYVCAPRLAPKLVFPRERPGDDALIPAGADLLVEFYRDSGEWIFLPDGEAFLCALAASDEPDRGRAREILSDVLQAGGGAPEAVRALEEEFGAGRAVSLTPFP